MNPTIGGSVGVPAYYMRVSSGSWTPCYLAVKFVINYDNNIFTYCFQVVTCVNQGGFVLLRRYKVFLEKVTCRVF